MGGHVQQLRAHTLATVGHAGDLSPRLGNRGLTCSARSMALFKNPWRDLDAVSLSTGRPVPSACGRSTFSCPYFSTPL